ncbi:hypothetical protein AB0877_30675 [Micromonospora sp. NPDC047644]|uniref:hypothetical protein n=1 Tax=Micromonospora sp. NPDC047644 TaxID=3157203 RepID=UPI0034549CFE
MTGTPEDAGAPTHRAGLAERQAELVAALVAGGEPPAGFAPGPLAATRAALLRKRAGEVARHWPLLAAGLGAGWSTTFAEWAARRPTAGSLRDGWDLARALRAQQALPPAAAEELAVREARLRYDGLRAPRPRRAPAVGRAGGAVAVQIAGRVRLLRPASRLSTRAGDGMADAAGSQLWISD